MARAPLQPPDAVQAVALVEDQVNVDAAPLATLVGLAVSVTVGVLGAGVTVTVADALALPPAPVQLSAKAVVALNAPVEAEPAMARAPLQPPDAVQVVAFVEDQVNVDAAPLATLVGLALIETVGAGGGGTAAIVTVVDALALPPAPVQVSV